MQRFDVHYGGLLKLIIAVATVLMLGTLVAGVLRYRPGTIEPLLMIALPLAVLAATALFTPAQRESFVAAATAHFGVAT